MITPMTFEEWVETKECDANYGFHRLSEYRTNMCKEAWQACEAEQAKVIAELQTDLSQAKETIETLNAGKPIGDIVGLHIAQNAVTKALGYKQTIAELKREIAAKDSLIDSYREMEADCTKQAQTISELVECLEEILIDTNEGQIMHIASEAIAKVKGK